MATKLRGRCSVMWSGHAMKVAHRVLNSRFQLFSVVDICCRVGNREYTHDCPDGWQSVKRKVDGIDITYCDASPQYTGPCAPRQSFADLDLSAKRLIESSCEVKWPCGVDPCDVDYSSCPTHWLYNKATSDCLAPESYTGSCNATQSFATFDIDAMKAWSVSCGVPWPCKNKCAKFDYSQSCPAGWSSSVATDGHCTPPKEYSGDCKEGMQTDVDVHRKQKLAAKCEADWPCLTVIDKDDQSTTTIRGRA